MADKLVSFVVPVLNEEGTIGSLLRDLRQRLPAAEIIVVDGGSSDGTVAQAALVNGVAVVEAQRGRGLQMNAGASIATGRFLFFLHCDTRLEGSEQALHALLAPAPGWGFFKVRLSGVGWQMRMVEWCMNLRSRLTGIATGDQLLFVQRDWFISIGGFAEIALMEDIELSSRLRRCEQPLMMPGQVCTSSRRWQRYGIWTTIWNWRVNYPCQ